MSPTCRRPPRVSQQLLVIHPPIVPLPIFGDFYYRFPVPISDGFFSLIESFPCHSFNQLVTRNCCFYVEFRGFLLPIFGRFTADLSVPIFGSWWIIFITVSSNRLEGNDLYYRLFGGFYYRFLSIFRSYSLLCYLTINQWISLSINHIPFVTDTEFDRRIFHDLTLQLSYPLSK